MLRAGDVTAVIVTRGDVDLTAVKNSLLPFRETLIYNNAERDDRACYGRFLAAQEAQSKVIYTQDDDVLCGWPRLLEEYRDSEILGSRPPVEPWRFLGVGSLFPKHFLDDIFVQYTQAYGENKDFDRVADVVFTYQHPYRPTWVGYAELEWSRWENRMYHQIDHIPVRERAVARIREQGWEKPELPVDPPTVQGGLSGRLGRIGRTRTR